MKKYRAVSAALAMAVAALALGRMAKGETLADRAPADAVAFLSWSGTDALGQAYEGSHLKGLMDSLHLPEFFAQRIQDEMQKQADDPQKQADAKDVQEWIMAMTKSPTALYVGTVDFSDVDKPKPNIALYSQVGKDRAAIFAEHMNAMIGRDVKGEGDKMPPVKASVAGDFILLTIGDMPDFAKRLTGAAPADGLSTSATYKAAMAKVGADKNAPAAAVYFDAQAALKMLDDGIAAEGGMGGQFWPKIEDALGLASLKQCAFTGNFDGANWTSQAFIGLGEKRTAYLAFLDNKPLTDETLKLIPKASAWAGVLRFDGARLLQDVRDAAMRIDPQNGPQGVDMALGSFSQETGVDLEKDLIDPMGDSFAYYGSPDATGSVLKNATIANKLKDPQKAEAGLTALETYLSTSGNLGDSVKFTTEALAAPHDKVTVHIIGCPGVSPAWTVSEGVLYISLSKAGIQSAVEGAGKASIMENPAFVDLWKKLGQKDMSSFSFADLSKLAAEAYPMAADALAKYKTEHPDDKTTYTLPALEKITPNLTPSMMVFWSDKDGFHARGSGPLPGMWSGENLLPMFVKSLSEKAEPGEKAEDAPKPGAADPMK